MSSSYSEVCVAPRQTLSLRRLQASLKSALGSACEMTQLAWGQATGGAVSQVPSRATDVAAYLADGTAVLIRPITPDDLDLKLGFAKSLSAQTRYQRFLSGRRIPAAELERLTRIDPQREMALIAVALVQGQQTELGVARYVRDADGRGSDFAIVVGDAWQGSGLGEALLRRLVDHAAAAGVKSMSGITLSVNAAMIHLARKLGFTIHREPGDATVVGLHRALEPLAAGRPRKISPW